MYHLEDCQLRVCGKWLRQERNKATLSTLRLIFLQHILPTTEELLRLLLESGAEVFSVFAKPYSIDPHVLSRLTARRIEVIQRTYEELEGTDVLDKCLRDAAARSEVDGKRIVILEVGGYFAKVLAALSVEESRWIAGVVEDTTFGHNRYLALARRISVPIVSVARSQLKEIEARFVGQDAVIAMDYVLRQLGVALTGRKALVIGYGMIGKNVARALSESHLDVSVYDALEYRNLRAFCEGFSVDRKAELLRKADIVFAATGAQAVTTDDIEVCKNNVRWVFT